MQILESRIGIWHHLSGVAEIFKIIIIIITFIHCPSHYKSDSGRLTNKNYKTIIKIESTKTRRYKRETKRQREYLKPPATPRAAYHSWTPKLVGRARS